MKAKQSLKTLYRSPVRMILTFILLVAVTFTLFSQVLEQAITVREIDKAAEQYDGVGAVEVSPFEKSMRYYWKGDPGRPMYIYTDPRVPVSSYDKDFQELLRSSSYEHLNQEQIDAISALPYITSVDTRYMTAGVSNKYTRAAEGRNYYDYNDICIIEATLEYVTLIEDQPDLGSFNRLQLSDCEIIAGDVPSRAIQYGRAQVWGTNVGLGDNNFSDLNFLYERTTAIQTPINEYGNDFVKGMVPGERYAFVLRFDSLAEPIFFVMVDQFGETWCDTVWSLEGKGENYLDTEEFAPLKAYAELIETDLHTFDVVYTDNTDSIMRFANGNMAIVDGRGITDSDSLNNPNVCVVSREFAMANELVVGDTVTLSLGDKLFEQYKSLGALSVVPERQSEEFTEVTLEIVGIYADLDGEWSQAEEPNWGYSINTFFVPKALLNVSEEELANHIFAPGEVSFVIENAWDIPAFLEESAPLIEDMGLTLIFEDGNWLEMEKGFKSAKELAVIKIGVLSAAVIVATWFVAMLYITGRKKDYAVMRVLGTTVRKSNRAMLLPLMTLVLISVIAGAAAAYINTSRTIESSNALQVLSEFAIDTSIPVWVVVLCIISEFVLALVIALIMLSDLGKKPPLALIQDNSAKRKKVKINDITETQEPVTLVDLKITSSEKLPKYKKHERRFVSKYVFRHIKRTTAKALLTVLLCVLLLNVIGQLDIMIDTYTELVETTVITSNYVGGLQLEKIDDIEESGYTKNIYYVAGSTIDANFNETTIVVTNDIERFTGEELNIDYAEGCDESVLTEWGFNIIVGSNFAEMYGITKGSTVVIGPAGWMQTLQQSKIAQHRQENPDDGLSDVDIILMYMEEINHTYMSKSHEFTVAGILNTESENYGRMVFTAGTYAPSDVYGINTLLDIAEATVSDNNLVDEYREFGEKLAGGSVTEGVMFVMDTSKLENLRNTLRLVEMLYPIAVVVTLVIGAFLCGLIIVQTSKDIAIMRVLGTSKAKTRTILVLEQMILCIVGIIISSVILHIRGALMQMLWVFCVYALVILLASVVASVAASRKNVLELLQTKE